jgi:hypothetical protein
MVVKGLESRRGRRGREGRVVWEEGRLSERSGVESRTRDAPKVALGDEVTHSRERGEELWVGESWRSKEGKEKVNAGRTSSSRTSKSIFSSFESSEEPTDESVSHVSVSQNEIKRRTAFLRGVRNETKRYFRLPQSPNRFDGAWCWCSIDVQGSAQVDEEGAKADEERREMTIRGRSEIVSGRRADGREGSRSTES